MSVLAIDPRKPTNLYAGTNTAYDEGGVFTSTNGGRSWRAFSQGLTNLRIYSLAISKTGRAYAGTDEGFYATSARR